MSLKNYFKRNFQWIITIILFLAVIFQSGYKIGSEQIKVWDESSGARNAVIMLQNNEYIVVMNNGQPDHHDTKPPLAVWLKVISYKIFGINEFAVRFPTLIAVSLTALILLLFVGIYLKKIWLANILLLLMASSPGYMGYHVARHGDPDALLALFTTLYSLTFYILLDKYPVSRVKLYLLSGIALALAYYTKSIAGIAPAAGLALYTLTQKNGFKVLIDYRFYLTGLFSIALILLYYIVRNYYDEGFLSAVYDQEFKVINNYPGTPKHPESVFYINYLWKSAYKPHFYILPIFIFPLIFGKDKVLKKIILFSFIISLVFLVGQSSIVIKNEWYLSPVYPFLWILTASGIYGTYLILSDLIKSKRIAVIVKSLIIFSFIWTFSNQYIKILKNNQKVYTNIYSPEREGYFFKICKSEFPELRNIKIISSEANRATSFYAEKYKYLEGADIQLFQTKILPELNIGDTIISCDKIIIEQIEDEYNSEVLLKGKYGNLYKINGIN